MSSAIKISRGFAMAMESFVSVLYIGMHKLRRALDSGIMRMIS